MKGDVERALQSAKRRLLNRYKETNPIAPDVIEAILDDFAEEVRERLERKK